MVGSRFPRRPFWQRSRWIADGYQLPARVDLGCFCYRTPLGVGSCVAAAPAASGSEPRGIGGLFFDDLNEWDFDGTVERNAYSPQTFTAGGVLHATSRVSLFYNQSRNSGTPRLDRTVLPTGRTPPPVNAPPPGMIGSDGQPRPPRPVGLTGGFARKTGGAVPHMPGGAGGGEGRLKKARDVERGY